MFFTQILSVLFGAAAIQARPGVKRQAAPGTAEFDLYGSGDDNGCHRDLFFHNFTVTAGECTEIDVIQVPYTVELEAWNLGACRVEFFNDATCDSVNFITFTSKNVGQCSSLPNIVSYEVFC